MTKQIKDWDDQNIVKALLSLVLYFQNNFK